MLGSPQSKCTGYYQRHDGRDCRRDEVCLDGSEYPHHADSKRQQPDYGHDSVHMLVRRSSVPKGDRNQDAEEDAGWEAHLRLVDIVVGLGEADDGRVVRPRHKQDAGEKTDRNAKVGEAAEVGWPIVGFDVDG